MEAPKSRGLARQLVAVVVVALLLASFGAYEYALTASLQSENRSLTASIGSDQASIGSLTSQLSNDSAAIAGLQSQVSSLGSKVRTLTSPCAETPPQPKEASNLYPNGTEVNDFGYPIFTLKPGDVGTFCMTYQNPSAAPLALNETYHAYDWNSTTEAAGVSVTSNATSFIIPPNGNATVAYVVDASNSATGYLSVGASSNICEQSIQLAVSTNASSSSFSNLPGLSNLVVPFTGSQECVVTAFGYGPLRQLTGFDGFGTVYLQNTTDTTVAYTTTGRNITSIVESPSRENITITVGVHSFASALTLVFATGISTFSTIRIFKGNPEVVLAPGDPCDGSVTNASAFDNGNFNEVSVLTIPGFTVNAPTVHVQPFSNATFTFSLGVDNPPPGYYITFLGFVIQWEGSPGNNDALNLSTYFPINPGSGQFDENIAGACAGQ